MVQAMKHFIENLHLVCSLNFLFKQDTWSFGIKLMNTLQESTERDQKNKVQNHKVQVQTLVQIIKVVSIVNKQEATC